MLPVRSYLTLKGGQDFAKECRMKYNLGHATVDEDPRPAIAKPDDELTDQLCKVRVLRQGFGVCDGTEVTS